MIAQAIEWWSNGLAAALFRAGDRLRRPTRFLLETRSVPPSLRPAHGTAGATIELPDTAGQKVAPEVLRRTSGSVIEALVPEAAILERPLEPLPAESRAYVDNVVRHQIETIFPWRATDVVHATEIAERSDGRIDVTVRATSRPAIASALKIAAACGASELVVVGVDGEGRAADRTIRVPLNAAGTDRQDRARAIARYAIVSLMLLTLGLVTWTSISQWTAADEIAGLDDAIAERRAMLAKVSGQRAAAAANTLEGRKQQSPVSVLLLEVLSSTLPDDTYLTDISMDGGRMRITGLSNRAAELVPLLENSGHFRNASFYAPTTRVPGRSADRFSIEAAVVPRTELAP